jgi:hypothetical protein
MKILDRLDRDRNRDQEDDQQHQHDVNQRGRVDFRHGLVFAAAAY